MVLILTISVAVLPMASAAEEYNAGDVAIFREIIQNGTNWNSSLNPDDPSTWGRYVTWSTATTDKRIVQLNASQVNLTGDLNVTGLTELTNLDCSRNDLTSLNVTGLTNLTHLNCFLANLTSLNVTTNAKLTKLECDYNQLTTLNVTQNAKLAKLLCNHNNLVNLDVSELTELVELMCDGNNLTNLDVTNNANLTGLFCSNNSLTRLDVTKNINLTALGCSDNNLTSLDVTNNINLTELFCDGNNLTSLDVANNANLYYLYCNNNSLTNLDVTKNTKLKVLQAHEQSIILPSVTASGNQLTIKNPIQYNGPEVTNIRAIDGTLSGGNITWTGLIGTSGNAEFSFDQLVGIGSYHFSGTVIQPWTAGVQTDEYTVTFNSTGGSDVPSQTVNRGGSVALPEAPMKEGYTFVEWRLYGAAYDFSKPVTSSFTLYAFYKIDESTTFYTVDFNSTGGSVVPSQTINHGGLITPPEAPVKEGYTFVEWRTYGVAYDLSKPVTSNFTLYAFYK